MPIFQVLLLCGTGCSLVMREVGVKDGGPPTPGALNLAGVTVHIHT